VLHSVPAPMHITFSCPWLSTTETGGYLKPSLLFLARTLLTRSSPSSTQLCPSGTYLHTAETEQLFLLSPPLPRVSLPPSPAAAVTALGDAQMTTWIFCLSQSFRVFILALFSCCSDHRLPEDNCWHPDCRSRWDRHKTLQCPCFGCLEGGDSEAELFAHDQPPPLCLEFVQSHGSCKFQLCSGR